MWIIFILASIALGIMLKSAAPRRSAKQENLSIPPAKQAVLVPAPLNDERLLQKMSRLSTSSFQLSGIALMGEKNFAIINGNIFKEGDRIKGAQLVKITKDEVTLDREGNQIHLSLK